MFDLQKYNYNSQNLNLDFNVLVRNDGIILFDASNTCNILGYERDASDILMKLDADEKILLGRQEFEPTSHPTVSVGSGGAAI